MTKSQATTYWATSKGNCMLSNGRKCCQPVQSRGRPVFASRRKMHSQSTYGGRTEEAPRVQTSKGPGGATKKLPRRGPVYYLMKTQDHCLDETRGGHWGGYDGPARALHGLGEFV